MTKKVIIALTVIALISVAASLLFGDKTEKLQDEAAVEKSAPVVADEEETEENTVGVTFRQLNESGLLGGGALTEVNGKIKTTIILVGDVGNVRPAHIHTGVCSDIGALGPVKYPLQPVKDGQSETLLDVSFAELAAQPSLAINVHKSANEAGTYVLCGEISKELLEVAAQQ